VTVADAPLRAGLQKAKRAPEARIRVDLQLIADMIAPGARVLDVGAGPGWTGSYLRPMKPVDAEAALRPAP